jgi:Gluconate 2-dehydrogenase subunit 3
MRRLIAGAAAGAAWPVVDSAHPIYAHLLGENTPELPPAAPGTVRALNFLSPEQNAALVPLAETMIPGSGTAQVSPFIDLLLSVDNKENQQAFVASLQAVDGTASADFGSGLAKISEAQRVKLLTRISEMSPAGDPKQPSLRDHFENLKEWITGAYYSSEIGMRELGWTGNRIFEKYPECRHDAHA